MSFVLLKASDQGCFGLVSSLVKESFRNRLHCDSHRLWIDILDCTVTTAGNSGVMMPSLRLRADFPFPEDIHSSVYSVSNLMKTFPLESERSES